MPIGMVPVEMRIEVMDIMVAVMVDIVVAVVVMMAVPQVNAKPAATKMNADAMPVVVIIVMIVKVFSAQKRGRPGRRHPVRPRRGGAA